VSRGVTAGETNGVNTSCSLLVPSNPNFGGRNILLGPSVFACNAHIWPAPECLTVGCTAHGHHAFQCYLA